MSVPTGYAKQSSRIRGNARRVKWWFWFLVILWGRVIDTLVLIPFPGGGLSLIGTSHVTRARCHMTSNIYSIQPFQHWNHSKSGSKTVSPSDRILIARFSLVQFSCPPNTPIFVFSIPVCPFPVRPFLNQPVPTRPVAVRSCKPSVLWTFRGC